jgi:hypothetical protein
MLVLVLGGTSFIGRRVVELLRELGDEVAIIHRGQTEPSDLLAVLHIHADRQQLGQPASALRDFLPDAVVDGHAFTAADVDAVTPVLPDVPAVVLSSQLSPRSAADESTTRYPWTRMRNSGESGTPTPAAAAPISPGTSTSSTSRRDGCRAARSCSDSRWSTGHATTSRSSTPRRCSPSSCRSPIVMCRQTSSSARTSLSTSCRPSRGPASSWTGRPATRSCGSSSRCCGTSPTPASHRGDLATPGRPSCPHASRLGILLRTIAMSGTILGSIRSGGWSGGRSGEGAS